MASGKAKPTKVALAQGELRHLSKKQIEERLENEENLQIGKIDVTSFEPPVFVKNNIEAYKKWKELIKLYSETDLIIVTEIDIDGIALYCKTYSEYLKAVECREEYLCRAKEAFGQVNAQDLGKYERLINEKLALCLKFQNVLFLNPASRLKASYSKDAVNKKKTDEEKFVDELGI